MPRTPLPNMTRVAMRTTLSSPQLDLADGELFGNDAGEDEIPTILASYFVDQPAFERFLSTTERLQVARSRKGMGKSALLAKLAYDLQNRDCIVIQTTGSELYGIQEPTGLDFMSLQNYWKRVMCARINFELGKNLGFAFSDRSMALVEAAEVAGYKDRNIIGALLQRIKFGRIPIEIIKQNHDHTQLLKHAADSLSGYDVWVLVDDIDSTFVNSDEMRAKTSTFFSACRSLVRDIPNLKIRGSVRTDVWTSLRKNEDLDKFEQYVTDIKWTRNELMRILSKKILSYFERHFPEFARSKGLDYRKDAEELIGFVFNRRLRWGKSQVLPFQPVGILSAKRPRWMAQLCRLAGMHAARQNRTRIETHDISQVMEGFGRMRLDDLYKEHDHQFADLQKLIETFFHGETRYSTKALLDRIGKGYVLAVGASAIPEVEGFRYKSPFQLAHFLFKIGFILGRREHSDHSDFADFVSFEERPELLIDARNPDDGLMWEVYPSYRNILRTKKTR
jgi:hypothetical protein